MEIFVYIIIIMLIFFFSLIIMLGIKVVPQDYVFVVERLGAYHKLLETGIYFIYPGMDRIAYKVSALEHRINVKHNDKEVLLIYSVIDFKKYIYGCKDVDEALKSLIIDSIYFNKYDELSLQSQSEAWGIKIISTYYK